MTWDGHNRHARLDIDLDRDRVGEDEPRRRVSPGKVTLSSRMYGGVIPPGSQVAEAQSPTSAANLVPPPTIQPARILRKPMAGASELVDMERAFQVGRGGAVRDDALTRAANSRGTALPDGLRRSMEQSIGADLGGVRVHTGPESANAAKSVQARAYTVGEHIHFAAGQYDPESQGGQHLIAHEVAHTLQQRGTRAVQGKLEIGGPDSAYEREADKVAEAFVARSTPSADSVGERGLTNVAAAPEQQPTANHQGPLPIEDASKEENEVGDEPDIPSGSSEESGTSTRDELGAPKEAPIENATANPPAESEHAAEDNLPLSPAPRCVQLSPATPVSPPPPAAKYRQIAVPLRPSQPENRSRSTYGLQVGLSSKRS